VTLVFKGESTFPDGGLAGASFQTAKAKYPTQRLIAITLKIKAMFLAFILLIHYISPRTRVKKKSPTKGL
jgi:hypothetical protein